MPAVTTGVKVRKGGGGWVATGEGITWVPVTVGGTVDVRVGVDVGGVPVTVGPGVPLIEPLNRNTWSGSSSDRRQGKPRVCQLVQTLPKAPPGLRQAAH